MHPRQARSEPTGTQAGSEHVAGQLQSPRGLSDQAEGTTRTRANAIRSSPELREDVGLSKDTSMPSGARRPTAAQNVWKVPVRTSPMTVVRKQLRRWRTEGSGREEA
jgi:hypothetical protein